MSDRKDRVCPVELHRHLDNRLRRLFHKPEKLLRPFIKEGDTAIDIGCGPGYFTIPMAELTGDTGKTIAADLQQGMLDIVKEKIRNTHLYKRIRLHRTEREKINLKEKADFILLFYMAHEVPDQKSFFAQIRQLIKAGGKVLLVEPPFHVSKAGFLQTLFHAEDAGFMVNPGPKMFLNKTALLTG